MINDINQHSRSNPWKGLNFYEEGEHLFGRDGEIQDLSLYIVNNTQVVLYGKSGIGKSSIIRAGVFPIARRAGLYPIPIRLKHDGQSSYLQQIIDAFTEAGIGMKPLVHSVKKNDESLWEFIHRHKFTKSKNDLTEVRPLLVFDQFEEIFTLQGDEKLKKGFFSNLADLINEVVPGYIADELALKGKSENVKSAANSSSLNFGPGRVENGIDYIQSSLFNLVFIIREDYLSYLERYTVFIPEMKSNRFALLPLNENQAEEIITKPVDGLVDKNVAKLILEKVTDRADISLDGEPVAEVDATILSLYLNRLYEISGGKAFTQELVDEKGRDIVRNFYNDCVKDFSDETKKKLGIVLDEDLLVNGHRDNQSYEYMRNRLGKDTLETLVQRKLFRTFPYGKDIRIELIHDKLCSVIKDVNEERLIREQQEEMRLAILEEEQLKRQKIKKLFWAFFVLAVVIIGIVYYKYLTKEPIPEDKYVDVMFIFKPDKMLEGDNWKARVAIEALQDSTYKMSVLNKKLLANDSIVIEGPSADTIMVRMLMSEMERPFNIAIDSRQEWLCQSDKQRIALELPKNNELQVVAYCINLNRDERATFLLEGQVLTQQGHPIHNAFIVFEEKLVRSNPDGSFTISMKDSMALKGGTLYALKSEYEAFEQDGDSVLIAKRESIGGIYNIFMQRREKYDELFSQEVSQTYSIIDHIKDKCLTANDSIYIYKYFGDWRSYKEPSVSSVTSNGATITYIFRLSNVRSESEKGRIFGIITGKNLPDRPFNGYLEEIDPSEQGKRRWRMNIVAHDSIFNQEAISGIILGKNITIDKNNGK